MRGVTLFEVTDDQIVAGRLYLEDVERDVTGIEQAVEALSGRRPPAATGAAAGQPCCIRTRLIQRAGLCGQHVQRHHITGGA
jgi:hypothetical protein